MPRNAAKPASRENAAGTDSANAASGTSDGPRNDTALHGRTASESGEGNRPPENAALHSERESNSALTNRAKAVAFLKEIGEEFVKLRAGGRATAWAVLEDRVMQSGHMLVSEGLISPKDWIGMAREIEDFRKSESGNQQAPGDFLAEWLSGDDEPKKRPGRPKKPEPRAN